MPRLRKLEPKPPRREQGTGSVTWNTKRRRWRARLPGTPARESWHLTRDEAEAWIARELARADDSFDPSGTVGAYLDYWLDLRRGAWGPQTERRYRYEAATLLGALDDRTRRTSLLRFRGDQAARIQARLLERKLTRRYVYNVMSLLRRALADAVKWRIVPENVVETVALPEPERRRAQAWTLDEVRAVLRAIVGHRFEACYLLILWGGLRIGEVVALRWDQIGADGRVSFAQAEQTNLRGRPVGSTKRERERETQLPLRVVARLGELRAAGPHAVAWPGRTRVSVAYVYVAQRPDGNRWTARRIRDDWNALVAGLTVQPLRPHGGRRSYSTMQMAAGTPLADLASLLGHSSPAVTAAAYLATSADRRREAAERMAALVEPTKEPLKGRIEGQDDG